MQKNPWIRRSVLALNLLCLPFTCLAIDLREEAVEQTDELRPLMHQMARGLWDY